MGRVMDEYRVVMSSGLEHHIPLEPDYSGPFGLECHVPDCPGCRLVRDILFRGAVNGGRLSSPVNDVCEG